MKAQSEAPHVDPGVIINRPTVRAVRNQSARTRAFLLMIAFLFGSGCRGEREPAYRRQLAISDVQSFLYLEPGTHTQVPQVRGSLRNLGNQTLIMVEFTLSFKDQRNRIIFEETAYPIYASSLSQTQVGRALAPGQQVKFAFKSPACPKGWQPGHVDVRVTKVVASHS